MASMNRRRTAKGETRYDVRARVGERTVTKTFKTERAARDYGRLLEADRVLGVAVDPHAGRMKLADYFERWLAHGGTRGRLALRTVERYEYLFRCYIGPPMGASRLNRLASQQVRVWHAQLATNKSPGIAAQAYRLLHAVCATAVEDRLLGSNPCRVRGASHDPRSERPLLAPATVLDLATAIEPRYRAAVLVAAFGGLRLGEMLALRRRDVDLTTATLRIDRQAIELRDGRRVETAPKTVAGVRTVALPRIAIEALAEHLAQYTPPDADAHVFVGPGGKPVQRKRLHEAWDHARTTCSVPEAHWHDLRHTAGTLAAQAGATLREVQAHLGHASTAAAMRYQHAAADRAHEIAGKIDELARGTDRASHPVNERIPDLGIEL